MNTGKAVKIALLKADKDQSWLARELGVTRQNVSYICLSKSSNTSTLSDIAKIFGMKTSELIALGED